MSTEPQKEASAAPDGQAGETESMGPASQRADNGKEQSSSEKPRESGAVAESAPSGEVKAEQGDSDDYEDEERTLPWVTLGGLGSMLGAGIYVALGIAAEVAGAVTLPALAIAAVLGALAGVSSRALFRARPEAQTAYEQGSLLLSPGLGFTAAWASVFAATTAGAAAALSYSAYMMEILRRGERGPAVTIAGGAIAGMALLMFSGFRRSRLVNLVITAAAASTLLLFVVMLLPKLGPGAGQQLSLENTGSSTGMGGLLPAVALLVPAYLGSRWGAFGKSTASPSDPLGLPVLLAVAAALILYLGVSVAAIGAGGAEGVAQETRQYLTPLTAIASRFNSSWVGQLVAGGAVFALLGVLLDSLWSGARTLSSMGQGSDLPKILSKKDSLETPYVAALVLALGIFALVWFSGFRTLWMFAAFAFLVEAAFTHAALLKVSDAQRRLPKLVPGLGLLASLGLILALPFEVWATGLVVIMGGHVLRLLWFALRPIEPKKQA